MSVIRFKMAVDQSGQIAPPNLTHPQLLAIGEAMVRAQKQRWSKGINALGAVAQPLKSVTAKGKATFGRKPIRNMVMTGLTKENFQLRRATMQEIRAENSSREARRHARQAQMFEPMIGMAPSDRDTVFRFAYRAYGVYLSKAWRPS